MSPTEPHTEPDPISSRARSDTFTIRVLQDPALDGPTNMARDEALMTRVGRHESPPTFRLYQWNSPTISLGYFQRFADLRSLEPPVNALPVVRRLTGGGAILHDLELTYSLTLPIDYRLAAKNPNRLYELAHEAIIAGLSSLGVHSVRSNETDDSGPARGPIFCFHRRHRFDILVDEAKIVGSAQRRTHEALLQHGSIVLGNRFAQQRTAVIPIPFERTAQALRSTLVERLRDVLGESFEPGDWAPDELADAEQLRSKYAGDPWTKRV